MKRKMKILLTNNIEIYCPKIKEYNDLYNITIKGK